MTLLPAFSIAADLADGGLVARPINNPMLSTTEAQVVKRNGRELPTAASHLLRFLVGHMHAFRTASGQT